MRSIGPILFLFALQAAHAQTGPGGVGSITTNVLWLRADNGVSVVGTSVTGWTDGSGCINNATSPALVARPTLVNGALNGYPMITFDGVDDQLRIPDAGTLDLSRWSIFIMGAENSAKNNNEWLSKGTNAQPNYALYSTAAGAVQMPIYNILFFSTNPGSAAATTGPLFNVIRSHIHVCVGSSEDDSLQHRDLATPLFIPVAHMIRRSAWVFVVVSITSSFLIVDLSSTASHLPHNKPRFCRILHESR